MKLKKLSEGTYSLPTRLIYGESLTPAWQYNYHVVPPITASSTFRLESAQRGAAGFEQIGVPPEELPDAPIWVYRRMGEPNSEMLQQALATAEQGECAVSFASGMAAVHAALMTVLRQGTEVIAHRTLYGCTYSLLTERLSTLGIKTHFVDLRDPTTLIPLVNSATRAVYFESPVNPTLELIDITAVAATVQQINAARPPEQRIITMMDNTFCTPWGQRPIPLGIDMVIHSLTKGISGFGFEMGGVVVTRTEFFKQLSMIRKDYGSTISPASAWNILTHGLPTLGMRIERQQRGALRVATYLEQHPRIQEVRYPGLASFPQFELAHRQMRDYDGNFAPGFMVYFIVKGPTPEESCRRGMQLMNFIAENGYAVTLAVSLGQIRTLIEHPGSMTHASYSAQEQVASGLDPGGIRLSVGIEEPEDIIRDLAAAIDACD